MKTNQLFNGKANYVSPSVKIASLRARRSIMTGSRDGLYGGQGSAGYNGDYDPYNEDNDL